MKEIHQSKAELREGRFAKNRGLTVPTKRFVKMRRTKLTPLKMAKIPRGGGGGGGTRSKLTGK
jgi:hypothetical protein